MALQLWSGSVVDCSAVALRLWSGYGVDCSAEGVANSFMGFSLSNRSCQDSESSDTTGNTISYVSKCAIITVRD